VSLLRIACHWFVRAALLAATGLLCFNAAGADAVARAPDLGARPVRIDRGRPRACLLLHGWLSTPLDFGDLPRALDEAGWDVYAPLHVGHGGRPTEMEGVTADALLDASRAHYEELRARYPTVALVGFSMGGTIATILAAEEPPDRLVLIAPFYDVQHKWYYGLSPHTWHRLLSPFLRYVVRPPGLTRVNRPEGLNEIAAYTAYPASALAALFDLRRRAVTRVDPGAFRMPVLLLHPTSDESSSSVASRQYVERMPSADKRVVAYGRSNHQLLHDYERGEAIAEIVAFLNVGKPSEQPPEG
jgi:carboxylesterase